MQEQNDLSSLAAFIREHRGSEGHFDKLYQRLDEEINDMSNDEYKDELREIKEKHADEYKRNKEQSASSWSEFEKFVTQFERLSLEMQKNK